MLHTGLFAVALPLALVEQNVNYQLKSEHISQDF